MKRQLARHRCRTIPTVATSRLMRRDVPRKLFGHRRARETRNPRTERDTSAKQPNCPTSPAPLQWWDMRQYVEDYTSGNLTMGRLVTGFIYASYSILARKNKFGIGVPFRWLYDQFQALVGGVPYPRRDGTIPADHPTPQCSLNLQPGELVRVKSYPEILATLNTGTLKNGGMMFDAELVPYCGGVYRVKARVERFLSEKTGRMMSLKTPAVILDGVWCQARYSYFRMGCPRCLYSWWREIWLERVNEPNGNSLVTSCGQVWSLEDRRIADLTDEVRPTALGSVCCRNARACIGERLNTTSC